MDNCQKNTPASVKGVGKIRGIRFWWSWQFGSSSRLEQFIHSLSSQKRSLMFLQICPYSIFGCLEQPNYTHETWVFKCRTYCVICVLSTLLEIVGPCARILHTATFFVVRLLQVCNLSPVLSKQCNADIMPGLSRIMCQCYSAIVNDASPTHWLESHLASVCLMTFWHSHLIFLPQQHLSSSLLFPSGLFSALCARNVKLSAFIFRCQTYLMT